MQTPKIFWRKNGGPYRLNTDMKAGNFLKNDSKLLIKKMGKTSKALTKTGSF